VRPLALLVPPVVAATLAACGSSASTDDRTAILRTLEDGRRALLAGDGQAACALATPAGRRRAMAFAGDLDDPSTPARDCADIVRGERRQRDARSYWVRDLEGGRFAVTALKGDRATVRFTGPKRFPAKVDLTLLRGDDGTWRVDDSDAVPYGQ
jgi:hypothetical protein